MPTTSKRLECKDCIHNCLQIKGLIQGQFKNHKCLVLEDGKVKENRSNLVEKGLAQHISNENPAKKSEASEEEQLKWALAQSKLEEDKKREPVENRDHRSSNLNKTKNSLKPLALQLR